MTDAEYEREKERVQTLFDRWVPVLGLRQWTISLTLEREKLATKPEDAEAGWASIMKVETRWPYMDAMIYVGLPHTAECSDAQLERHMVHELCHIIVNEMRCAEHTGCSMRARY